MGQILTTAKSKYYYVYLLPYPFQLFVKIWNFYSYKLEKNKTNLNNVLYYIYKPSAHYASIAILGDYIHYLNFISTTNL